MENKIRRPFHRNVIEDLKEFKQNIEEDHVESLKKAATEWKHKNPIDEKSFLDYYKTSAIYLDASANYNKSPKKLRLIAKIEKVIKSLKGVNSILDYGCGPGSDALELCSQGYWMIAMDLGSEMFNFLLYRTKKYKMMNFAALEIDEVKPLPYSDLILSLDVLEHAFNPYKPLDKFFQTGAKYLLLTTAFKVHNDRDAEIPHHTDYAVAKIEKYIQEHGYKKIKLNLAFPPRLFVREDLLDSYLLETAKSLVKAEL